MKRFTVLTGLVLAVAARGQRVGGEPLVIDAVVLRPLVEVEVPARHTGVLATLDVEEGAAVEEGQTLAALDDRAARLAVAKVELERDQVDARARNELRIQYADKALEVARAEMKRSRESNEQFARSISQSQLDVERLTIEKLELERRQAEHELSLEQFELRLKHNALEAARLDLELHEVRAPFAGVVSLVRGRRGQWVEPGTPVLRLVAVDKLRAEGFAPASLASVQMQGAPVQLVLLGESAATKAEGVLRFVSPEIDPVSRQVRVWAEFDNADRRLHPGQQGQLLISVNP